MIHWNTWRDSDGVRYVQQRETWQEAFRFMDHMVSLLDHNGRPKFREVCYQRLPEGVAPTA